MSRYKQPYTLYKRGKYYYYQTYTPEGRRTVPKTTGLTNKTEAKKYLEALYLSGNLFRSEKLFKDYALHFYDDDAIYITDRVKPLAYNTVHRYRRDLNSVIIPYFDNYKLSDITYSKLKEFRSYLINTYSVAVTVCVMSTLKQIIQQAFRDGLISVNPYLYLEPLKATYERRDAFTLAEVLNIYKEIPAEFKPFIGLMCLTGMRISEAAGVELCDIKDGGGFKYIDLYRQYNRGQYIPVKMGSARQIPIDDKIIDLLTLPKTRRAAFYRYFEPLKDKCNNAAERKLSVHSFRHFFITNAKAEGIPEIKVEYVAGHKKKGMEGVYTNFKAADAKELILWQQALLHRLCDIAPL